MDYILHSHSIVVVGYPRMIPSTPAVPGLADPRDQRSDSDMSL